MAACMVRELGQKRARLEPPVLPATFAQARAAQAEDPLPSADRAPVVHAWLSGGTQVRDAVVTTEDGRQTPVMVDPSGSTEAGIGIDANNEPTTLLQLRVPSRSGVRFL